MTSVVLTLALGGLPVPAHAARVSEAAATDVVNLKSGGMVRGQIVELLPDKSLTVVSAAGETMRFTWAELANFERGGTRTEVGAGPAPASYARSAQPGPGAPRLYIELTRPADLKLFEVTGEMSAMNFRTGPMNFTASRPVCVAPCGQVVDGRHGQSFFFNGDGVIKSRRFTLSERSGDILARVRPGRAALRVGGVAVMILGGIGLGTSGLLFLTVDRGSQSYDDMGRPLPRAEPNYLPATAVLISGALVAVGGLVMVLLSRTRVQWSQRTAPVRRRLGLG